MRHTVSLLLFVGVTATSASAAPPRPLDRAALETLRARSRASHSTALAVWQRDKLIVSDHQGPERRLPLMSCTKSVVALAVAKLIDERKIASFDQPVSDFYPEWKQGQKRAITLRHLLAHTSGMQNVPITLHEIYPAPDVIKLALAAELSAPPGTNFSYNNKAVNLLAGIIAIAAGQPMDRYIDEAILQPLGIVGASWGERDPAGNPLAMSGLALTARELVQIGRLVLGRGAVDGKRVVSAAAMDELLKPGSSLYAECGLLWWRIPKWKLVRVDDERLAAMRQAGVDERFIAAMATLKGRRMTTDELLGALKALLGADAGEQLQAASAKARLTTEEVSPEVVGYETNGYLGEYLVIYPAAELIGVRMIEPSPTYRDETDGFEDFDDRVRALAGQYLR